MGRRTAGRDDVVMQLLRKLLEIGNYLWSDRERISMICVEH